MFLICTFVCSDEEGIMDLSDFNLLHVWLLTFVCLVTYFDLSLRSRLGQYTNNDLTTMTAAFTFIWGLENYIRLLLLVFCLHSLMPLEIDLVELVELYQAWGSWLVIEMLPGMLLLGILFFSVICLNQLLNAGHASLILHNLMVVCLTHLVIALFLLWDLAVAGLSSITVCEGSEVFYLQPNTALTFDSALGGGDLFEWHRERGWPYSLSFEDLYFFMFQLLLAWDVLCSLFFWLCTLITALSGTGSSVSFTQVAVGLAWLEHIGVALVCMYGGLAIVALRVFVQSPGEFGIFWW